MSNADVSYDRLQKDVTALKSDISNLTAQLSEAFGDMTDSARKNAKRGMNRARANVNRFRIYGRYVAEFVSVSQTSTETSLTPAGNASDRATWYATFSVVGLSSRSNGGTSLRWLLCQAVLPKA